MSRLAVAIKRRLLLWSWHDSELASETSELPLATGIKTLTWVTGTKLVVGLTSSYVLVDVGTLSITDIVGPGAIGGAPGQDGGRLGGVGVASIGYMGLGGSAPKPLATRLGEGEVLLAKDINTLFMTQMVILGTETDTLALRPRSSWILLPIPTCSAIVKRYLGSSEPPDLDFTPDRVPAWCNSISCSTAQCQLGTCRKGLSCI